MNAWCTPCRKNTGTLCMVGTGVPNSAARSTASRLDHAEAGTATEAGLPAPACEVPAAASSSGCPGMLWGSSSSSSRRGLSGATAGALVNAMARWAAEQPRAVAEAL